MKPIRLASALALLLPVAVGPAGAQQTEPVPAGYYVVSASTQTRTNPPIPGGLWLVHPRRDQVQAVGKLPAPLITGANAVLYRASDATLVVGHLDTVGRPIELHVVQLIKRGAGWEYDPVGSSSIRLGVATAYFPGMPMGVHQMAWLPDGDLLVQVANVGGGPVQGQVLARIDLKSSSVTPIDLTGAPRLYPLAMAHDSRSGLAFVSFQSDPATGWPSDVWAVDPLDGAEWQPLCNLPGDAHGLQLSAGRLVALCTTSPPRLLEIGIHGTEYGRILKTISVPGLGTGGFCAETTTGGWTCLENSVPGSSTVNHLDMPGFLTTVASPPPGTWGILTGIAWSPNPIVYGLSSPLPGPDYRWQLGPDPRLMPMAGNLQFSLEVRRADGDCHPGVWFLCDGRANPPIQLPLFGVELLLCGSMIVPGGAVPIDRPIPLPIPNSAALIGVGLCLQTLHADPTVPTLWAMSEGVELTIL